MKNIPKVIFAIHSLSHFLAKKGIAPRIRDLRGELSFTEEQLRTQGERLDESGLPLPSFGSIESSLAKEVKEPTQEESACFVYFKIAQLTQTLAFLSEWNLQYRSQQAEIALIQALWRAKVARRAFLVDIEVYRQEQLLKKQREEEQLRRQLLEKQRRDAEQQEARERERAHRLAMEQRDAMRRQKESEERARDDAARKIQNWMRALKARELESMRTLSDPALATVRKYLYLADSTNADFAEEAELEELRHQVIRAIRLNSISETELRDLETKISLLIRNKVTLDEVVHTTTKQYRERSTHERDGAGALGDIFAMRALDTESRHKLEGYQSLFYVLQTQPVYLGKLMFLLNRKWGAAFNNFVEGVVMALFGYAQQAREEYMLLQLIKTAIQFEVKEAKEINDITKAQPFYVRLLLHYTRAPGQRKYLQQTLQPLIKEVIEAADLDLDTDPLSIYRATIRDQETKSGEKSTKPFNLSDAKEALADEDTRNRFTKSKFIRLSKAKLEFNRASAFPLL